MGQGAVGRVRDEPPRSLHQLTPAGRAQVASQVAEHERINAAILTVLRSA